MKDIFHSVSQNRPTKSHNIVKVPYDQEINKIEAEVVQQKSLMGSVTNHFKLPNILFGNVSIPREQNVCLEGLDTK